MSIDLRWPRDCNLALRFGLVVLFVGCLTPDPPDGAFRCSPTGKACPSNYYCAGNGTCYRDGHVWSDPDGGSSTGKRQGEPCSATDTCDTGHCVDGYCCNSACDGQCQACDVSGSLGTCMTVMGPPHGSRTPCNNTGTLCGGSCDGLQATCVYASDTTVCGAACDGRCDGAGGCSSGDEGACPNGFACGASLCKTSCASDSDCQTSFTCVGSSCVRIGESDCLDGVDNNGDGKIDCADPTCVDRATCVPAVAVGAEVGYLDVSGCSDPSYANSETFNQSLNAFTCAGCACSFYCGGEAYLSTGSGCNIDVGLLQCTPGQTPSSPSCNCLEVSAGTYQGVAATVGPRCATSGSSVLTPPSPVWATTTHFCAASRSSSSGAACDGAHICVAKPAGGKACARVPTQSAACPGGYPTLKGTYYPSSGYAGGSCSTCGCSVVDGRCSAPSGIYVQGNCGQGYIPADGVCATEWDAIMATIPVNQSQLTGLRLAPYYMQELTVSGTCNASATVTQQPSPSNGSTICCQ